MITKHTFRITYRTATARATVWVDGSKAGGGHYSMSAGDLASYVAHVRSNGHTVIVTNR
jgi:hypothetical protein